LGRAIKTIRRETGNILGGIKMSKVTQAFREHHRKPANQLSNYATSFAQGAATADAQGFATFLKTELVPHAAGEEA
jgi:hypothetical protein